MFQSPVRKRGAFVSKVTDTTGKTFRMKIVSVKIAGIHPLTNDNGYILKLWVPRDSPSFDTLKDLDEKAFHVVQENNQKWFKNSLDEEKIRDYFRPSLTNDFLCVMVSNVAQPRTIMVDSILKESFTEILAMDKKDLTKCSVTCNIDVQGLYFYPNRFGIRWIIRDIFINHAKPEETLNPLDMCDKHEIDEFWSNEVADAVQNIDNDIQGLQSKIDILQKKKQTMKELLSEAVEQPDASEIWSKTLDQLKTVVFEYTCGRL